MQESIKTGHFCFPIDLFFMQNGFIKTSFNQVAGVFVNFANSRKKTNFHKNPSNPLWRLLIKYSKLHPMGGEMRKATLLSQPKNSFLLKHFPESTYLKAERIGFR